MSSTCILLPAQDRQPAVNQARRRAERLLYISHQLRNSYNTYGWGDFCDLLGVLNPFSSSAGGNLLSQLGPILEDYREGPGFQTEEKCPFPAYPEPGGLLPVARDSNGDDLFWLTSGEPDSWTLIHYNWRGGWEHHQYPMPLVRFLAEWVSGLLPESFFGVGNSPKIIRRDPVFCPAGQVRPRRR